MQRGLVLAILAAAACGDGKHANPICRGPVPCTIDSGLDSFGDVSCDLLTQTGCRADQKCTWVYPDGGEPIPSVTCAPTGSAGLGSACTFIANHYDDCARGLFCMNNRCRAMCALDNTASCGSGTSCVVEPVVGDPPVGLCEPTCDPLADNDFDGSGSAFTRSGTACGSSEGCFGEPRSVQPPTAFSCRADAHAGSSLHHRTECTPDTGCIDLFPSYYRACNQGYEPVLRESTAVSTTICVALCAPLDCYAGNCGSNNANAIGAAPHRCSNSDALGTFGAREHCMYMWRSEIGSAGYVPSRYSNTTGLCVDHAQYQWDSNGDGVIDGSDAAWPDCATLPLGSAAQFGCVSTATAGTLPTTPAPGL